LIRVTLPLVLLALLGTGCVPKREITPERPWETDEGKEEIRLKLAELLIDQGRTREGQQILATMRREEKPHKLPASVDLLQGEALYKEGMYAQAEALLLGALERMKGDYRPSELLGLLYADTDRLDEAVTYLRRATEVAPQTAHLWNNLGYLLFAQQDFTESISALEKAVSLDGTKDRYRMNLGFSQLADGRSKDAFNTFRSVGSKADAHYNMGHAFELRDDWQQAHSQYAKALELNPGHDLAYQGMQRLENSKETP